MIKISLKYSTSKKQEAAARTAIEYEILYNPNLNGSVFKIGRGDFTCIDGLSGYDGAALKGIIDRAVRTA